MVEWWFKFFEPVLVILVAGVRRAARCWFDEEGKFGTHGSRSLLWCLKILCIYFFIYFISSGCSIFVRWSAEITFLYRIFPENHLLILFSRFVNQFLYLNWVTIAHISLLYSSIYFLGYFQRNFSQIIIFWALTRAF